MSYFHCEVSDRALLTSENMNDSIDFLQLHESFGNVFMHISDKLI